MIEKTALKGARANLAYSALPYTRDDKMGKRIKTSIGNMISLLLRSRLKFVSVGGIKGFTPDTITPIYWIAIKIRKASTITDILQ